jgi:hypothetical protein
MQSPLSLDQWTIVRQVKGPDYYWRWLGCCFKFYRILFKFDKWLWINKLCVPLIEFYTGIGLLAPDEALNLIRDLDRCNERILKSKREALFLGADKQSGDVYASKPSDLICMTRDEHARWYKT